MNRRCSSYIIMFMLIIYTCIKSLKSLFIFNLISGKNTTKIYCIIVYKKKARMQISGPITQSKTEISKSHRITCLSSHSQKPKIKIYAFIFSSNITRTRTQAFIQNFIRSRFHNFVRTSLFLVS